MKKKRNLSEISKLSGESLDIKAEQAEKLKSLFPQVVKDGEIDFEALKLALGSETDTNGQSYGLSWAGKADCFRHIQEATTATLKPVRKESVDFDNTENIFIEGDNLEVLKVLQKNYYGKIKMIYIDPPYNTGSDSFIYPDRFKEERAEYEERAGIKDAEGLLTKDGFFRKNSKDTGHFHSNWLCMMYPRLFLAKNLLRQDGVIFVSIDDNEVHNLRMVMNEIFGEENFVSNFLWKKKSTTSNVEGAQVSPLMDYVICYRKTEKALIKQRVKPKEERNYPYSDEEGSYRLAIIEKKDSGAYKRDSMKFQIIGHHPRSGKRWQIGEETARALEKKDRFIFQDGKVKLKIYTFEDHDTFSAQPNVLDNHGSTDSAAKMVNNDLFGISELFDNPKPVELLTHLINISSDKTDIILDFFAGSCTTAHTVMALNAEDGGNRKYICVQLAEPCEEKSEAYKAGFKTIADIGKERIRRAGKKIKAENKGKLNFDGGKLDLGFKVFKLDESNFKQWRETIKTGEELKEQIKMFVDNKKKGSAPEDMLYEIILKNSRFDLNVPIKKKTFDGIEYYVLATENTEKKNTDIEIVCLAEKITKKLVEKILKTKPQKFTCLDTAFKNNDQLKTNTALQMKAQEPEIEFKVI